jgi:hypothetical protein
MRRFVMFGLLTCLLSGLALEEASACGRWRHRSRTCCPCKCKGTYGGIGFVTWGCIGGSGTYSWPDTKITDAYFKNAATGAKVMTCTVQQVYGGWSVKCTQPPQGTYYLCVVGDASGEVCSPTSFPCPIKR